MRLDEWRSLLESKKDELKDKAGGQRNLACANLQLCRALARAVFDERGHLDFSTIDLMIEAVAKNRYCLIAGAELDTLRRQHVLKILHLLKQPSIAKRVNSLAFGLYNRAAEQLVQQTLPDLNNHDRPNDQMARVAVVCAWMTYLRQNVGSCFATAPAIAIQGHHPDRFLGDMHQLLQAGMLTRSIDGKAVTVPLLTFWGSGDLWRPFRLDPELARHLEFINAVIAADLFEGICQTNDPERMQRAAQDLIANWLATQLSKGRARPTLLKMSAGRILRDLLLFHLQITAEQFEQWDLRSKSLERHALETSGILVQQSGAAGSIAKRCLQLRDGEERAHVAFKATADNALLRAWEYTLASFSESRADFQQWNLSIGLGMQGEPGGLSMRLNELINQQIGLCNESIKEGQERAEQIRPQVIYAQGKLQNANSEQDLQWARAEYYQIKGELDRWEEHARITFRKGEKLVILGQWFVEKCIEGFREQFQEVYDPDLRPPDAQIAGEEVTDDTPAGFRLVAKEGRSLATSWMRIEDGDHFIAILCRFFTDIETQFRTWPEVAEIESEFGQIITHVIQFVREEIFLKGALQRLQNRQQSQKDGLPPTPWAYISGGNLEDLLHQYCSLPAAPAARSRWFDDVRDFWVYLIDEVQRVSVKTQEMFLSDPEAPLLMSSPDHAFNLKPGLLPFCQGWLQRGYPYSFIRDTFEVPVRKFYGEIWLTSEQQEYLVATWRSDLQRAASILLPIKTLCDSQLCRVENLHSRLANSLLHHPLAKSLLGSFEAQLFSALPLMKWEALSSSLGAVFERAGQLAPERFAIAQLSSQCASQSSLQAFHAVERKSQDPFLPAWGFWEFLLDHWQGGPTSASDDLALLQRAARELGLLAPAPVTFADSNWMRDHFAFAINPATLALEIWCVERFGQKGRAMSSWRPWLDGSHPERKWALYPQTAEADFFQIQQVRPY